MKCIIAVRKTKYGYDTNVPALRSCHSQGDTEREAIANTRDAVLTYLEMEEDEVTNVNVHSKSFDFLADESELYSLSDLKEVTE